MSTHLVFTYGSLKTGFHNHGLLVDCRATPLGVATTDGRYLLLKGAAFPFLIDPEHFTTMVDCACLLGHVAGELYRVDDRCLARLDQLEGHPDFYRRELITVNTGVQCWAYFLTKPCERGALDVMERDAARPDDNGIVEWKRDDVFADEEG